MSAAHKVSQLTTYRVLFVFFFFYIYLYNRAISPSFTASDCKTEIYQHSLCEKRREKKELNSHHLDYKTYRPFLFYRFIHQRGIRVHYKNRNIDGEEALTVGE